MRREKGERERESIKHILLDSMLTYSSVKSAMFNIRPNDSIGTDNDRESLVKPPVVHVTMEHVTGLLCKVLK